MLRYTPYFLMLIPFTTLAFLHYNDNEGQLYCEMICRVDSTAHKTGLSAKNGSDGAVKVRGKWRKTGWTYMNSGTYEVSKKTMAAIQARCDKMRPQLLQKEPIRGLLEDADISGVSEKKCKIHPRILTALGAVAFEVTLDLNEESEQDEKEL